MTTAALIPVSEYLTTAYHPDVDYVDGHIEERFLGESDHSDLQRVLTVLLSTLQGSQHFIVKPEWRTQISAERFRVPDIALRRTSAPKERIARTPPLLCIEILSPEDRMSRTLVKVDDYLAMGVPEVWVFDPDSRTVHVCTVNGMQKHTAGKLTVPETPIAVDIAEVFSALDED